MFFTKFFLAAAIFASLGLRLGEAASKSDKAAAGRSDRVGMYKKPR